MTRDDVDETCLETGLIVLVVVILDELEHGAPGDGFVICLGGDTVVEPEVTGEIEGELIEG